MDQLEHNLDGLLNGLGDQVEPGLPGFQPTGLPHIWTGRVAGASVVLKRSVGSREALVYRRLGAGHHLPLAELIAAYCCADDGCWLLLEPVECPPPGLSPHMATHWWRNPHRRDRVVTMLATLHAQFWNLRRELSAYPWLRWYRADDYWQALDQLGRPPDGWPPLSHQYLGQLASAAEMLIAGPLTLIHGGLQPEHVGWRGITPVLLDWEEAGVASPFVDLGRLLTRGERDADGRLQWYTRPHEWRPLLQQYRAGINTVANLELSAESVSLGVRNGMLWELAVDLHLASRSPAAGDRETYEATLTAAEGVADEPWPG